MERMETTHSLGSKVRPRVPVVLSFLSFLDILFATIGVFVVVLTVKMLAVKELSPVSADAVVILKSRGEYLWYQELLANSPLHQRDLESILERADKLSDSLHRPARVLVAFSFAASNVSVDFERLARQRWLASPQAPELKSATSTTLSVNSGLRVRFAWRPLESSDPDGIALAARAFNSRPP
jgi:hypothetical protein